MLDWGIFDHLARPDEGDERRVAPALGPFDEAEIDAAFARLLEAGRTRFAEIIRKRLARRLRMMQAE